MTKKHFIALADTVRQTNMRLEVATPTFGNTSDYMLGAREHHTMLVDALADFCASQNPRFDRARWLGYIAGENGPSGGAVKARKA